MAEDFIKILHDERRRAIEYARSVVERANKAGRADLDSEEQASYDRAVGNYERLTREIGDYEQDARERADADLARASLAPFLTSFDSVINPDTDNRAIGNLPSQAEIARLFSADRGVNATVEIPFNHIPVNWSGRPEVRLNAYAGAGRSELWRTINATEIYQTMIDAGAVWQYANVVNTPNSNPHLWPKATAYGSGTITAEAGTIGQGDPTLGTITTRPYGYKWLMKTGHELLTDSSVSMVPFITDIAAKALAQVYSSDFAIGAGSAGPQGITVGGSVVVQSAGTATPDTWLALKFATNPSYQNGARFVTNNANLGAIMRYRTDGGGTLGPWAVSPGGDPRSLATFAGHEIVVDQYMPAHGSAVKSLAFVSPQAYLVHAGPLRFERSDDRFFDSDEVGFRTVWPLDGRVIDNKGVSLWQATAS